MKKQLVIDKISYLTTDNNYYSQNQKKKQIIIDISLRKDNYHLIRLQHSKLGKTKNWPCYSINRKGNIFQHFNNNFYSDYIGDKQIDKKIIPIVLENMGFLYNVENNYFNSINETCNEKNVINIDWLDINFWEKFSGVQLKNTGLLCKKICEEHNISKNCVTFFHYHENINNFEGIVFKSNFFENSMNFNPSFDIEKFNEYLI